jgi:uncharacterized repeat protein (TIGR02543 family)
MKSKTAQVLRIPSLLLAAALQVLPIVRVALPAAETAANVLAIVFRWAAGAAAALGGVQAVSGASTVITNPLSTNIVQGQTFSLRLTTAPDQAHYWEATGLPAGLSLSGTNGQSLWQIVGTPTASGSSSVGLTAKDTASSGASRTVTATLVINVSAATTRPTITTQPASQTVTQGSSVSFSVAASGTAPLSYQWRYQSGNLTGQTGSTLTLGSVTTNHGGNYDVMVANASGSVTSSVATLTVTVPVIAPAITTQPAGSTVTQGQNATFTVGATGTAPLSYFWRQSTAVVARTATGSFTITNAQPSDAGSYSVIVSNSAGTATSTAAVLAVNPAPQAAFISAPPADRFAAAGGTVTFTVGAGGTTPLTYQWYFKNAPLPGQRLSSLGLTNIQAGNAGGYFVVVTNAYGSATSAVATLTVVTAPVITVQPQSVTNFIGSTVTLSVSATSAAPLLYQWRKAGTELTDTAPFSGVASNILNLFDVQTTDAGGYSVVISNAAGAVTSQVAVLTVAASPTLRGLLTVSIHGGGIVSPDYSGQMLEVGTNYTLTATPSAGYVFASWSGDLTASTPVLTFTMQSNLVLQANFIPLSAAFSRGSYHGLFYEANEVSHLTSGSFAARTTDQRQYSGNIMLIGRRYSFSGTFDLTGRATNTLYRGRLKPLTLELTLDQTGADQLHGLVTDGSWVSQVLADRAVFDATTRPAPQAGTYTLLIPGTPGAAQTPAGDGFVAVKVGAGGQLRFKGILADGTRVTQRTAISKAGEWPLYVSLFAGEGSILGWLTFTDRPDDDINGWLSWSRLPQPSGRHYPAGFAVLTQATGSRFTPAVPGASLVGFSSGQISLTDGNLTQNLTRQFTTTEDHPLKYSDGHGLVFSLSPSSGLFKGRAVDPATGRWISFKGAVLQKQEVGSGFFLGATRSGRISFGP